VRLENFDADVEEEDDRRDEVDEGVLDGAGVGERIGSKDMMFEPRGERGDGDCRRGLEESGDGWTGV
jgi:hypothetical protein